MKEFQLAINPDILKLGLRKNLTKSDFRFGLSQCVNMEAEDEGLVPYMPITVPFSEDDLNAQAIEWDWPFPQFFKGRSTKILATRNRLFEVDGDWMLHRIATYNADDESSEIEIPSGRAWSFVDLGKSWFMFNGMCVVFSVDSGVMFGDAAKCLVSTGVRAECGCDFHGRMLIGGFDQSHSWSSDWQDFVEGYADNSGLSFDFTIQLRDNFVWWSSIGGGDLTWMMQQGWSETGFVTTARGASEAPYSSSRPMLFDLLKRNEMGFMPMPFSGRVRAMKELGEVVMVYGDDGVAAMIPARFEVGSGFGVRKICDFGIINTGAVGGDNKQHFFLDQEGRLWTIDAEMRVGRIDYKEFLSGMINMDAIVSYEPQKAKAYICDNHRSFVVNRGIMTETRQLITSVVSDVGIGLGIATLTDYLDKEVYVKTGNINFEQNGFKTITQVGVLGILNSSMWVRVWYSNVRGGTKYAAPWVLLNREGVARVNVSGIDFEVQIKASDFNEITIQDIIISYQLSDRRYIRGQNAYTTQ